MNKWNLVCIIEINVAYPNVHSTFTSVSRSMCENIFKDIVDRVYLEIVDYTVHYVRGMCQEGCLTNQT